MVLKAGDPQRVEPVEPAPPGEVEHSRARRIAILLICCMSLLIVGIDVTAVNVALPSIGRELHAPVSGLQWTVDAYTVVLGSFLILGGSIGDRFGRKETFMVGLTVFCIGSLLCSRASSIESLIGFRALQACGGSMLNPVAMSIITNTFTDRRERAMAIGIWGSAFGLSLALGPVVGGALVSLFSWRAIFLLNLPVCVAAFLLTLRFIPRSKSATPRRLDPIGQVLVIVMLSGLTYGIIELPSQGWTVGPIGAFVAAVAAFAALVYHEPRREQPLIDLRFFRSIPFSSSVLTAILGSGGFSGYLFLNTLYLQDARGFSPIKAGLYTLPMAALTMLASPVSGRLVGRRGPRIPLVLCGLAYIVGCVLLTGLTVRTAVGVLFVSYVMLGFGFGMINAPITTGAVSGMPRSQAGVASAIATTSRQIGQSLGVAIVGALVTSGAGEAANRGLPQAAHPAFWLMAGFGALVLFLAFFSTTRHAAETARRTATTLNPEALVE